MSDPLPSLLTRVLAAFLAFLPMAALGTVSHELGHWLVGAAVGAHPVLHYGQTSFDVALARPAELAVVLGGPASTVGIGTLGLAALYRSRARTWPAPAVGLAAVGALFWSREPFNLATMIAWRLILGETPARGDEPRLSVAAGLGPWPLSVLAGAAGLAACLAVVAWVPAPWRAALLTGGVAGCFAGMWLWYGWLGPLLLP